MTKRMLIDASHAEETRVVMLDGNRLEEYDVETATKKQLKGNIYLAKIVRVEPSLQAAFVEYGGNRHGFLAFSEIHPDYFQIPVADRQRLLALQEEEAEAERAAEEAQDRQAAQEPPSIEAAAPGAAPLEMASEPTRDADPVPASESNGWQPDEPAPAEAQPASSEASFETDSSADGGEAGERTHDEPYSDQPDRTPEPTPETMGGQTDGSYERPEGGEERRAAQRMMRHYKIQEVIRRRQIILVQVVKEERGTKGAALTTYISLAGRFCVLMPNSPRGGGVSRKITSVADRKRLKEITSELDIPKGMAMIVRTAGAQRPRPEIKRDCEYLLRLWDDIRDTTMASMAPSLIYEEASLIKRAIRDVYSADVDEIMIDGEEAWRAARGFMRTLMPAHARKVQLWRENQPLFARNNVEGFLDAMMSPSVQLRSGGYLVINQTEALVAIDVNSGRSTRERGIEETALRTNMEAADEVARQLRLRDLAGLIVIDFIDMESRKHNFMVERRLKEALRQDRARIQVGTISHFGLMEMSRQRLRPSLVENSFVHCEHCNGTGLVRGVESASLHVLRAIESAGAPRDAAEIAVHVAPALALYILNNKRLWLAEIERRCVMQVHFEFDDTLQPPAHRIVKTQVRSPSDIPAELPTRVVAADPEPDAPGLEEEDAPLEEAPERPPARTIEIVEAEPAPAAEAADAAPTDTPEEAERKRKRRRRRRRGERREDGTEAPEAAIAADEAEQTGADMDAIAAEPAGEPAEAAAAVEVPADSADEATPGRSRRGRRSGRRRSRRDDETPADIVAPDAPQPVYSGPTPADPFNGAFDIFDVLARSEDQYMVNMSASAASFGSPAPATPERAEPEPQADGEAELPLSPPLPEQFAPPEPEPPPAALEPETEPASEPAIQPILVGAGEPAARRSGWWRR